MAEEPKDLPQGESMAASDTTTDSPPESELQDTVSAEEKEATVAPATSNSKSMEPKDETFWEDSVDASAVNLSDGGTAQAEKDEGGAAEGRPASGDAPAEGNEENTTGGEAEEAAPDETAAGEEPVSLESDAPREDNAPADEEASQLTPEGESPPVTDNDIEIAAEKEEENATEAAPESGDTPAKHPPADESSGQVTAEDASQEVKDTAEEIAVENNEEGGEETVTVTGAEAQAETEVTAEGEDKETQESELELLAETEPEGEESTPEKTGEEDTAAGKAPALEKEEAVVAADPAEAEGEGIKPRWRPTRKAAMIAAGILLLIVGSVGFSVVFELPSGDTITSTFPGKQPENAYDMKFFLPLNVGYEEARFVKVTIAIELMDKGFKREIDKNVFKLRQEVIDLLLTKSPKEVKSAQGKNLLRQEITARLNNYLATDCIKDTYFTELVIL